MTSVDLGMPAAPPPVLAPRRKTRQIKVGKVLVGGDAPVSVQSMTTTLTSDVNTTLQQIAELTAAGCDIVRVACPRQDDADALRRDRAALADPGHRRHPLPAEVRLRRDRRRLRRGPGQPRQHPQVRRPGQGDRRGRQGPRHVDPDRRQRRVARQAAAREVRQGDARGARRVGRLGGVAVRGARLPRLQDLGQAQRPGRDGAGLRDARRARATGRCTSASPRPGRRSRARSSRRWPSARCCRRGIGDTIRVSLSAPPVEEVKVGIQILQSLNLRPRKLEIVSCPSCGRAQVDVYKLADEVTAGLEGMEVPLRVAVMGCVVNGPGEAREADLGVASGNGKGQIFVKGEVDQDRAGVEDRRDPDRGGDADRRGDGAPPTAPSGGATVTVS